MKQFKLLFFLTAFIITGTMPVFAYDQYESMKVGETKTFYFPSEVTSRAGMMYDYNCTSDHINNVEIVSYTKTSVTVKALAYTASQVNIRFDYWWEENGNRRTDTHMVHIDLSDNYTPNPNPDLNPNDYFYDYGCWGTIEVEVGKSKTVYGLFNTPDPSKIVSIGWTEYMSASFEITSQSQSSCTIKGRFESSGDKLWCLMKYGNSTYKAYYLVNVKPSQSTAPTSISVSPASKTIKVGETFTPTYALTPSNATSTVTWSSDNSSIASVNSTTGKVTGVKTGTTYIRATTSNGKTDWCKVTVEDSGISINATNFPDANFRSYLLEQDYGKDGVITDAEIAKITFISVSNKSISSLKGIEYFTALTRLFCYDNQLTALDMSKNTALTFLWCQRNQLTVLNVSKNTALTTLSCSDNQLTALDVSKNTALTDLSCSDNQLTALDVSKNTALTDLTCSDNRLTALDVSNTALTTLYCYSNQLTALNVLKNTALTLLSCHNNQLTALDVSKNTALTNLSCSNNQFTSLDVSKNTALTNLSCSSNQLTALDVSKNTALTSLYCYSNQLTALDVSKNTALTTLRCYKNYIKGAAMDRLINSLPQNGNNTLYIIHGEDEGNVITKKQVAAAKTKGWTPQYYNGLKWTEYEGSEDDSEEPDDPVTPDNPTAPISIALPDIETVSVNSTIQLTPTLEPADAVTELTWASDDETIAKVTSTGRVAGIKAGTAIISVHTSNGLTAECFVIVQDTSGIVDVKTGGNANAPIYNLSGQKVANVKKGIYIINGHKVVIK